MNAPDDERSITVFGPLTDDDLREIVETVQRIEGRRPDETFNVFVDAPDVTERAEAFMWALNPLRHGYGRVVRYFPKPNGL